MHFLFPYILLLTGTHSSADYRLWCCWTSTLLLSSTVTVGPVAEYLLFGSLLTLCQTVVDTVGQASAQQQFASVQDVVAGLPELSVLMQLLNTQLKGTIIPKWLQDPSFNGTVFASVNGVRSYLTYCYQAGCSL